MITLQNTGLNYKIRAYGSDYEGLENNGAAVVEQCFLRKNGEKGNGTVYDRVWWGNASWAIRSWSSGGDRRWRMVRGITYAHDGIHMKHWNFNVK